MAARIKVAPAEERTAEGIVFHSKREMQAYCGFRALEKSGQIKSLMIQVAFPLLAYCEGKAVRISEYRADFVVQELDGTVRVYDSKGFHTEMYKLKKKIFGWNYPHLRIVEI